MDKKEPIKRKASHSKRANGSEDDVKIYTGEKSRASSSPNTNTKPPAAKRKKKKAKKQKGAWVKVLRTILIIVLVIGLAATVFVARYVMALAKGIPDWD